MQKDGRSENKMKLPDFSHCVAIGQASSIRNSILALLILCSGVFSQGLGDARPRIDLPTETVGFDRIVHTLISAFDSVDVVALVFASPVGAQLPAATFENGHYHPGSGITFDVPGSWRYDATRAGETAADETAHWIAQPVGADFYAWLSARKTNEQLVEVTLDGVVEKKTAQRARKGYQHLARPSRERAADDLRGE